MNSRQVKPGLWHICAAEPEQRGFGKVAYTDDGIMYSAYLMDMGEGFAAFGSLPERYTAAWLAELKTLTDFRLKWAVFFGTDSDRAAAKALLAEFPEMIIIGGTNGLFQLRCDVERDFSCVEIRSGRTLVLGRKKLAFHVLQEKFAIPGIYVVDEQESVLLTADAFGSILAAQVSLVSELEDRSAYFAGVDRYFREIRGRYRPKSIADAMSLVEKMGSE